MNYIDPTTKQEYTLSHIRDANPRMSIPEDADLSFLGLEKIQDIPPDYLQDHQIVKNPPEMVDGVWKYVYIQTPIIKQRIIRDWEFRGRFTQQQLVGILRNAISGDDSSSLLWLKLTTASDGVNLDSPDVISGVEYVSSTYPNLGIDPSYILR